MPADNDLDPLDRWLSQEVWPMSPPDGALERITKRARRRKIRKVAVSVASAAAVAAAVAVAVPLGLSGHLGPSAPSGSVAAGRSAASSSGSGSASGSGIKTAMSSPLASGSSSAGSASPPSAASEGPNTPGYLPPNFAPSSVTWDSLSTGWVIGPAGAPGHCADAKPDICTSVAHTDDGGQTWHGLPAPSTGGPMSATGVTGLRFLNATYGWAFGPELWATDNGGESWHKVGTGNSSVTDLETASGRAYALFGDCTPPVGPTGDTIANCRSFTLETSVAGSDKWTPVGGVPASLSRSDGQPGSAVLELASASKAAPATGYLVAPDGTLYEGPLDGSAWHRVTTLPCDPGSAANGGLPRQLMLAPDGVTASVTARLAIVCEGPGVGSTIVYLSNDNGAHWVKQSNVGSGGTSLVGVPESLTTLPDGTLILATTGSTSSPGGIYFLPLDASKWQPATLSDPSGATYGFTYVGMTSASQGVALGGNPKLHAIWMTFDGGQTWQVRPIKSS